MEVGTCKQCGEMFENPSGRRVYCKRCEKERRHERTKLWKAAHAKEVREKEREYQRLHKKCVRKYGENNAEIMEVVRRADTVEKSYGYYVADEKPYSTMQHAYGRRDSPNGSNRCRTQN